MTDKKLAACDTHLASLLREAMPATGGRHTVHLLPLATPDVAYSCSCRASATWYARVEIPAPPLKEAADPALPSGWAWPTSSARKAHYFAEGDVRSACGKYGRHAALQVVKDNGARSSSDCAPCARSLGRS